MSRSELDSAATALEFLSNFSREGINLSGIKALMFIAMASSDSNHPMLPNVNSIATAINISLSGASRLLKVMGESKNALIDRARFGARDENFFLTVRGRELVNRTLSLINGEPVCIEFLDPATFAKAKFIDRRGENDLSLVSWHDTVVKTRTSKVREVDVHRFADRSQALLFLCQNLLPISEK